MRRRPTPVVPSSPAARQRRVARRAEIADMVAPYAAGPDHRVRQPEILEVSHFRANAAVFNLLSRGRVVAVAMRPSLKFGQARHINVYAAVRES